MNLKVTLDKLVQYNNKLSNLMTVVEAKCMYSWFQSITSTGWRVGLGLKKLHCAGSSDRERERGRETALIGRMSLGYFGVNGGRNSPFLLKDS